MPFHEFACIGREKLLTPLAKDFIAGDVASSNQKLLHLPKLQTNAIVQPLPMTNNFGWKTMALIAGVLECIPPRVPNMR